MDENFGFFVVTKEIPASEIKAGDIIVDVCAPVLNFDYDFINRIVTKHKHGDDTKNIKIIINDDTIMFCTLDVVYDIIKLGTETRACVSPKNEGKVTRCFYYGERVRVVEYMDFNKIQQKVGKKLISTLINFT